MRRAGFIILGLFAATPLILVVTAAKQQPTREDTHNGADSVRRIVIDEFSLRTDPESAGLARRKPAAETPGKGLKWVLHTAHDGAVTGDRVMRGAVKPELHDGKTCLHLRGRVSAGPDGGFIEARAHLQPKTPAQGGLDVSDYDGVYVKFKGVGTFSLRLGAIDDQLGWQFHQAAFVGKSAWTEVRLPFRRFKAVTSNPDGRRDLDLASLRSIAVASMGRRRDAEVYIDEIGFYKEKEQVMRKKLTPAEQHVILRKGTEAPFTGRFTDHFVPGVYTCKQCGAELFKSDSKFHSGCGWPSFDEQIPGAVKWQPDRDGRRTEIICNACGGHLGHVFKGEGLTPKNLRYCVNSVSLDFIPAATKKTERAIFASGCFWGTEYHLQRVPGVISTTVGYTGGHVENPTYKQVCTDTTGHAEAVEVVYDPTKTTYEQLAKLFFETHDFTQLNRQGPDIGRQYRSAIFYVDERQEQTAQQLIDVLRRKGFDVKTEVTAAGKFWPAEDYHQDYYESTAKTPYCHIYRKIF